MRNWLMRFFYRDRGKPDHEILPPPPPLPPREPDPELERALQVRADFQARLERAGYELDIAARTVRPRSRDEGATR